MAIASIVAMWDASNRITTAERYADTATLLFAIYFAITAAINAAWVILLLV
ncbi:MAG TPA: hypothetical protein VKP88_01195 [Candidatus Paceibacterota bacterium]|nr:hypothetical protein [Candidatus Paceibacterota bacterium]